MLPWPADFWPFLVPLLWALPAAALWMGVRDVRP